MVKLVKYFFCLTLLTVALLSGGCNLGDDTTPKENPHNVAATKPAGKPETKPEQKPPTKLPVKENAKKEIELKLYFPNDQGTKLVSVTRKAEYDPTVATARYQAAILALIEGTSDKGQTSIIPHRVKLRGITLNNGNCQVDFSSEIVKNFVGGSTGEEMLVGSVVNTLTEFPEVRTVQILVDGHQVESLSGHMDLSQPLKRMENLLK